MIKIKLLRENVIIPTKAHEEDAGFDVYALESKILFSGERYKFPLGFALEFDKGIVCITEGKSGLANKFGLTTIGNVIDSNYRGECHVIILNSSRNAVEIVKGKKIAQLVFQKISTDSELVISKELSTTKRGGDGFGSTGK